ncbi:uncharacterized protein LOC122875930 isoform X2 [Siniperca chuatsi]|uniref:uncharacterized protein LOC122875930 isoform X2 n=1 Tax=Siniperca chuatsi TaxID=119488 RepID=UPI001CE1FBDF|nr:uncharacterized protein LOC122875930 isoform X2 [Siniperca chuatsi]
MCSIFHIWVFNHDMQDSFCQDHVLGKADYFGVLTAHGNSKITHNLSLRIHRWRLVNAVELGVYPNSCSSSISAGLHTSTASDISADSSRTSVISAILVTSIIPAVLGTYPNTTTSSVSASFISVGPYTSSISTTYRLTRGKRRCG